MQPLSASLSGLCSGNAIAIAKGLAILAIQAALTVVVLFFIAFAVILASNAPYEDMLSVVGWVFWSAVVAVVTTTVVVVVGLPIRLIPGIRRRWQANGEVALVGGAIGVILVIAAFLTGSPSSIMTPSAQEFVVLVPNGWLLLAGWFLFGFSCAHVLWPRRWTRAARRVIAALQGTTEGTP